MIERKEPEVGENAVFYETVIDSNGLGCGSSFVRKVECIYCDHHRETAFLTSTAHQTEKKVN